MTFVGEAALSGVGASQVRSVAQADDRFAEG